MKQMTKCRYSSQYKGKNPPKCGCDYCKLVWELAETERLLLSHIKKLKAEMNDQWHSKIRV